MFQNISFRRKILLLPALAALGGMVGPALVYAAGQDPKAATTTSLVLVTITALIGIIPLAGPFVLLGTHGDEIDGGFKALPIVFGIIQNAGMIMTVLGLSIRREVQVPRYATLSDAASASFEVAPMGVGDGVGVGITLRATE